MKVGNLGKPVGTLEILVHLFRNEKATVTNLIRDAGLNQRTTYSALSNLQDQKLVCRELTDGFPVCKYYKLTKKGQDVATLLNVVDGLLAK